MKRNSASSILLSFLALILVWIQPYGAALAQVPPPRVSVLPVFIVAKGQRRPSKSDKILLMKHLNWAQRRYREMLSNRSTFDIEDEPKVYQSKRSLEQYKKGNAADIVVQELLDAYELNRFSCEYVFLAVFVNEEKRFPNGGGRPINGGVNTGGGIVIISTHRLKQSKDFQSTLQHELGHSFGLMHVEAYGYDMRQNDSVMSYNKSHHTKWLSPSKSPGQLIPEDIRGLAFNDRVFKNLEFDKKRDVPRGYELKGIRSFGPMNLPNHPLVIAKTTDGEAKRSSVKNIVHSRIKPSIDRGEIEFDRKSMWQSERLDDGIASVDLTFPMPVALNRIKIYSQHSGKRHGVTGVEISVFDTNKKSTKVGGSKIEASDGEIEFELTKSKQWRFDFRAGQTNKVVLRGLRFFNGDQELFPPRVPCDAEE